MSIYVKLGALASSVFIPLGEDGKGASLSNHKQVIEVDENNALVRRFIKSEGIVKATAEEFKEYRDAEDARLEKEKIDLLAKRGYVQIQPLKQAESNAPSVDVLEALKELQSYREESSKLLGELATENGLLKEQNEKLLQELNKKDKK